MGRGTERFLIFALLAYGLLATGLYLGERGEASPAAGDLPAVRTGPRDGSACAAAASPEVAALDAEVATLRSHVEGLEERLESSGRGRTKLRLAWETCVEDLAEARRGVAPARRR